ncbi:MAG TPA: response regulator, partial [Bacteroidia bacterium]|nr:response regulator [Bacteroidia bacterium]
QGISILLVEDNDFNRIVAVDTLQEELPDIKIDIAVNGLEAVEKVKSRTYDVVLMDVQMPEMNGYDATRTIRTLQEPACNTRIIAMTASALKDEVERCYQAGMNDFIAKPFDTEDLLKKIRRMIHGEV